VNLKLGGNSIVLQGRVMMPTAHVSTWVVIIFISTLPKVMTDSSVLNRLNLGGSMSKIGETFVVSSSFSY